MNQLRVSFLATRFPSVGGIRIAYFHLDWWGLLHSHYLSSFVPATYVSSYFSGRFLQQPVTFFIFLFFVFLVLAPMTERKKKAKEDAMITAEQVKYDVEKASNSYISD